MGLIVPGLNRLPMVTTQTAARHSILTIRRARGVLAPIELVYFTDRHYNPVDEY